jgi:opacity protein-like surface antigen
LKARSFWLCSLLLCLLSLPAQAAGKSAQKSADKSADKAADPAAGKDADKSTDEPASKAADESKDEAASKTADKPAAKDTYVHGRQFGLRVGLVGGYNMVFRYEQSPLCSPYDTSKSLKDQQKFCGHGAPLALEFAASYAVLDFLEPYLFMRLGLSGEKQTDTLPIKVLGAGVRIYTMSDSAFKIFIEPALAYEFEGSAGTVSYPGYNPQYKKDLLIHLAAGPQFDVARYVGFYAHAGLTTGVLRALHTQLELQGGVQARFP